MANTNELYAELTKEERARFDMVAFDLRVGIINRQVENGQQQYFGEDMANELTFSLMQFLYERMK